MGTLEERISALEGKYEEILILLQKMTNLQERITSSNHALRDLQPSWKKNRNFILGITAFILILNSTFVYFLSKHSQEDLLLSKQVQELAYELQAKRGIIINNQEEILRLQKEILHLNRRGV